MTTVNKETLKEQLSQIDGFICDMDGVIYYGSKLLPGVKKFVNWLKENNKSYLFLTNASDKSPADLRGKLLNLGLDVDESHFYTSALATARFLASQSPGCSAYVIGEPGLINALYDQGISMNDTNPDYVVVGEGHNYNYETIIKACNMVNNGARLIGTNYDITGPRDGGIGPACRAFTAPIELATGKNAYFIGKPNPLMVRTGLRMLGTHSEKSAIIGDRMDTDIVSGIETGMHTFLVLTGVTDMHTVDKFPYRPEYILKGVCDIPEAFRD